MSKRESISRYDLIIKFLRKKQASFEAISEFLQEESFRLGYRFELSKRTFQRDIQDISSIYGIQIKFNRSAKVYQIESEYISDEKKRSMEAFDVFNALKISENLSQYIEFDSRKPKGTEYLFDLLYAIRNSRQISFLYTKFDLGDVSFRTVDPIKIKEFKGRWYLIAFESENRQIKTFGFDRMSNLIVLDSKQSKSNLNQTLSFKNYFGIITSKIDDPQEVILSFDSFHGQFVKAMSLHASQEIVAETDKALQVKLNINITYDFVMELLSYGHLVKVLSPESLKTTLINELKKTLKTYSNSKI